MQSEKQIDYCQYCIREKHHHGGDCYGKHDYKTCLLYERDPRGKPANINIALSVKFHQEIPKPDEEFEVTMNGIPKTVHFINIKWLEWNKPKEGLLGVIVHGDIRYWTEENGVVPPNRPILRLVQAGEGI